MLFLYQVRMRSPGRSYLSLLASIRNHHAYYLSPLGFAETDLVRLVQAHIDPSHRKLGSSYPPTPLITYFEFDRCLRPDLLVIAQSLFQH